MVAFVLTQPEVLLVIVLEQDTKETRVKMVSTAELHVHVQQYKRRLVVLSFFICMYIRKTNIKDTMKDTGTPSLNGGVSSNTAGRYKYLYLLTLL